MHNSKIKSIVTVNAYEKKYYALKGKKLSSLKNLEYNSANLVASYINHRDLISTTIELSRSILDEDIQDIIEIKAYEEFGLDQASEYVVRYNEKEIKGDVKIFDIFVAKRDVLEKSFGSTISETKYIDLLVPSPLLYQSLYNKEILSRD
ncbi:MAG TPA: hypothetical protein ENL02_00460, partial [Epsilonproteobacteria bacterium]|nr:hypothetical protein [Campylobacterota bacterium]